MFEGIIHSGDKLLKMLQLLTNLFKSAIDKNEKKKFVKILLIAKIGVEKEMSLRKFLAYEI